MKKKFLTSGPGSWKTVKTQMKCNSEDPDEMLHKVAFHQDLHCLSR